MLTQLRLLHFFFLWRNNPNWAQAASLLRFLNHIHTHTPHTHHITHTPHHTHTHHIHIHTHTRHAQHTHHTNITHTPHTHTTHTHHITHTHTHTTPHTHHTHTHHTTHTQSHTTGKTPLNEWSARRTDLYLHNTQETQETSIHALCVIRTRDSCNQTAADLRVIPQGHRNQLPPSLLRLNNRKQADLYMSAVRSRQWRILIIKKPTRCPISQLYLVKNYTCFLQIYCPPSRVVILYSKQ